jgi:hypothetical protein
MDKITPALARNGSGWVDRKDFPEETTFTKREVYLMFVGVQSWWRRCRRDNGISYKGNCMNKFTRMNASMLLSLKRWGRRAYRVGRSTLWRTLQFMLRSQE